MLVSRRLLSSSSPSKTTGAFLETAVVRTTQPVVVKCARLFDLVFSKGHSSQEINAVVRRIILNLEACHAARFLAVRLYIAIHDVCRKRTRSWFWKRRSMP